MLSPMEVLPCELSNTICRLNHDLCINHICKTFTHTALPLCVMHPSPRTGVPPYSLWLVGTATTLVIDSKTMSGPPVAWPPLMTLRLLLSPMGWPQSLTYSQILQISTYFWIHSTPCVWLWMAPPTLL